VRQCGRGHPGAAKPRQAPGAERRRRVVPLSQCSTRAGIAEEPDSRSLSSSSAIGGPVAGGQQYVSWLHDADFVQALRWLIARNDLAGAVNLAAPNPLPYAAFMRALRVAWGMPIGLPLTSVDAGRRGGTSDVPHPATGLQPLAHCDKPAPIVAVYASRARRAIQTLVRFWPLPRRSSGGSVVAAPPWNQQSKITHLL